MKRKLLHYSLHTCCCMPHSPLKHTPASTSMRTFTTPRPPIPTKPPLPLHHTPTALHRRVPCTPAPKHTTTPLHPTRVTAATPCAPAFKCTTSHPPIATANPRHGPAGTLCATQPTPKRLPQQAAAPTQGDSLCAARPCRRTQTPSLWPAPTHRNRRCTARPAHRSAPQRGTTPRPSRSRLEHVHPHRDALPRPTSSGRWTGSWWWKLP